MTTISDFEIGRVALGRPTSLALAISVGLCLSLIYKLTVGDGAYPPSWQHSFREEIDEFADWVPATFSFLLNPIGDGVDATLRRLEAFFLWLPWIAVVTGVFLLVLGLSGLALALFSLLGLLYIGFMGLWDSTVLTFTQIGFSVAVAVMIGIPLGVWAARSDRVESVMRPLLDAMQTMPTFVYLIPVLVLFGFGRPSAVLATIIFAAPPIIRLTNLGIRQISPEAVEAARSFGSTSRQILFKVQLPLARPSVMMGLNQTIMMALGMVIIVVLIGAPGLGKNVWLATKRVDVGQGLEAGLAVVLLAIILDRTSYALSQRDVLRSTRRREPALFTAAMKRFAVIRALEDLLLVVYDASFRFSQALAASLACIVNAVARPWTTGTGPQAVEAFFKGHSYSVASVVVVAICIVLGQLIGSLAEFPTPSWFHFRDPVNSLVDWMNIHLGTFTELIHEYVFLFGLRPIRDFLLWLPWPVLILGIVYLAAMLAGRRIALLSAVGLLFIGVVGMWTAAIETFSLVAVAVGLSVIIAVPLGILASRSDLLSAMLRPVLDTMQTLPAFVYLPLVIILFKTGPVAGVVATVIYAIPPAVRLTNLGIREIPLEVLEAARSCGSSPLQILFKVRLPLALPSIMLGINQTIILGVGMAVYASLIGAPGLGLEILEAIGRFEIGWGFESGLSVVILAVIIDRITQGLAKRR